MRNCKGGWFEYWPAKIDYQIIYILHYIGLAWNFAHWVMDGAQLWHLGDTKKHLGQGRSPLLLGSKFHQWNLVKNYISDLVPSIPETNQFFLEL